ncbi:MAG: glutamate--cysteine ligase [Myxococcales bacterium]|nr:glutamate--cysteine ligase [Myxococcales bacterium]
MSRDVQRSSELITSKEQLTEYFRQGIKPPEARRVGTEHEKLILDKETLAPVPFEGPRGIGRVLELLAERYGYQAHLDQEHIAALVRANAAGDDEAITTEPGGQFELSGAPFQRLADTEAELTRHIAEVAAVTEELGLVMLGTGINPMHTPEQIPWMPKSRYRIMRAYMPRVGALGHWMMKATCTVQANFDYTSEADAADILRTGLWISPIISALFAHSPLWHNAPSGYMTTRCYIWTDTDPDRCGFPLWMMEREEFGFADYVEYALDVPMYFIHRDGRYVDMSGHSLRRFIEDGYEGHEATMGDYELHLSTLFPEVRMKRYIEVRGADMGPLGHVMALPALWKGLLYDAEARASAQSLMRDLTTEQRERLFTHAIRWSLNGPIPADLGPERIQIRHVARELVSLSRAGLERLAAPEVAAAGPDEARYLEPLQAQLDGEAPSTAHALLARWEELGRDTGAWARELALSPR